MKVKELIEKLRELDPDLDVYYGVSDTWFWTADEVEVCDPDNFGEDVCLIYLQVVEMNVGELIEKLQELNPNLPVYFTGNGTGVWFASDLEVDEYEYYGEVCMIYH